MPLVLQSAKVRWAISPCLGGMQAATLLDPQFQIPGRTAPPGAPDWAKGRFTGPSLDLIDTWDARWDPFREVLVRAQVAGSVTDARTGVQVAEGVKALADREPVWAVAQATADKIVLVWPDPARLRSPIYLAKTWTMAGPDQPYSLHLEVTAINLAAGSAEVVVAHDVTTWQRPDTQSGGIAALFGAPPDLKGTAFQLGDGARHLDSHGLPDAELADRAAVGLPGWIGTESRYFLLASAPVRGFAPNNDVRMQAAPSGVLVSRLTLAPATLQAGAGRCVPDWLAAVAVPSCGRDIGTHAHTWSYAIYTGPKDHDRLAAFGHELVQALDFGWFGAIALPMLFVLQFGHQWTGSWPVAILLLTLLVKVLLWPITAKSMKSMKQMARLKPELDKLRADHEARAKKLGKPADPQELNRATFELYRQHGVNPVGGCLPLLLQMPIYIALYRSINASVSLFNQPLFGWIGDMTQKDPYYVLPLVLGAVMFVQQKITPQAGGDPAQQKMMLYFMPVLFTVMMLGLPSGLTLYILINTLLSVAQTWAIQRSDAAPPAAPANA
ncbi:MAG: membrane protein insertase YidC [Deltaproteobacteria bacterium]|nr:membrane protein insertase YidC [Deltaproteobacteria bacterium]